MTVLKRIDGKWEYDLKELIKYVEEESKKFVGKADLQKAKVFRLYQV